MEYTLFIKYSTLISMTDSLREIKVNFENFILLSHLPGQYIIYFFGEEDFNE